ncbi:MAG: hypothetical protein JKX70_07610 [Phycisphaerales bacterium]|nr:hypothetical protein [Phycisphaerales bacterium]
MNYARQIAAAAIVACCSTAYAGPVIDLAPGEAFDGLSGIMNTEMSELIGSIEADMVQEFTIFANSEGGDAPAILYQGSLRTMVARSFETGLLHFNYRLTSSNPEFAGLISNVEVNGFEGIQTRVEYRDELTSPGDVGPSAASRSANGDVLDFDFGESFDLGEESRWFFAMLDTDAFSEPGLGIAEGGATATIYLRTGEQVSLSVFGAGPIPTPGTLALLSVGGMMGIRRRR